MAPNNFRFHRHVLFQLPRKVCFTMVIVVVKTNIDITFANNRCFDLSLAEFMTFIILSYEMSVV